MNGNQSDQVTKIMINIGLISKYTNAENKINNLSFDHKINKIED